MRKRIIEGLFFLLALVALGFISDQVEQIGVLADPIKFFYFWSGWLSFGTLIAGMLMRKWGRFLGHCALLFALWHTLIFLYFDFGFAWDLMGMEILQKYYLYAGIFAFLVMLFLGFFSFFGTFFRPLVWFVFACVILSLAHIVMIQKVLDLSYWAVVIATLSVLGYKITHSIKKSKSASSLKS